MPISVAKVKIFSPTFENNIDLKQKAEAIENKIREFIDSAQVDGVIIGLSGGIDSGVLATLAVRTIGKEKVKAYYLFDRDSLGKTLQVAELIARQLGIELKKHDITAEMKRKKIYKPLTIKFLTLAGPVNRFLNSSITRLRGRESFFVLTLRKGPAKEAKIRNFLYKHTIHKIEEAFNARHIFRREFLEQRAKEQNLIVLGAANRTEKMLGWFVKGGIDDMKLSPLCDIYKTDVIELAKYLNLPGEILRQKASPDMLKGITDESALGLDYPTIDTILKYIERGLWDEEILVKGINKADLQLVRTMNNLSQWKRS